MAKKDTKAEETALQTQGTQAMAIDYGDDAVDVGDDAKGYEGQTAEDQALPFIKLVQSGTPELKKKLVQGLEEGDWLNTVSNRVWKNPQGLLWVSAITRHEFIRYHPQDAGGGFVSRHQIDSPEVAKAKAESTKFGHYNIGDVLPGTDGLRDELSEQFYSFGVFCDEEGNPLGMGVLPFKSTGIKCYKNWMSQIRMHTVAGADGRKKVPPMYAHLCRFTTYQREEGKKVWSVPTYVPANDGSLDKSLLLPSHDAFIMARQCYEMVSSGAAKVDYSKMQGDEGGDGGATKNPVF